MGNLRAFVWVLFLIGIGAALSPMAHAEWWRRSEPKDFEECSQAAERSGFSKDAKEKIITMCDSKFAGRRKVGGGYTYFDFMQNRHFDIAGPNPTSQELKRMDQEYLAYLEMHGETPDAVDAGQAIAAINNQIKPVQKPAQIIVAEKQTASVGRPRARKNTCKEDALACGWARITSTVTDLGHTLLGRDARREAQRKL